MGRIPDQLVAEVRQRTDVVSIVSRDVALKKRGTNYIGLCPFHGERTPSFNVSPSTGIIKCFGCGWGGNVFNYLMERQGITFPEAVRELAVECGVVIPDDPPARKFSPHTRTGSTPLNTSDPGTLLSDDRDGNPAPTKKYSRQQLFELNGHIADWFVARFRESTTAQTYWASRGYTPEEAEAAGIGWGGDNWDGLVEAMRKNGANLDAAVTVGVLGRRDDGGLYNRFKGRLIFPITETSGRVCGFGGRILEKADNTAKYINSPESLIYHKSQVLFGLYQARDAFRTEHKAVICEGYFDCLGLWKAGIRHAVAPCGTALTDAQAKRLKNLVRRVILLFDADAAGRKAALRASPILLEAGLEVFVASLESGEDPDTYVQKFGADAMRARLEKARPVISFLLAASLADHDDGATVEDRAAVLEEVAPALKSLPAGVIRTQYIHEVSDRLRIGEHDVVRAMRNAKSERLLDEIGPARIDTGDADAEAGWAAVNVTEPWADLFALACLAHDDVVAGIPDFVFEMIDALELRMLIERVVHDALDGVRQPSADLYLIDAGGTRAGRTLGDAVERWSRLAVAPDDEPPPGRNAITADDALVELLGQLRRRHLLELRDALQNELREAMRNGDRTVAARMSEEIRATNDQLRQFQH